MLNSAELYATILADLYAGTLEDDAWNRALTRLCDFVGASGANVMALDLKTGAVLRDETHRMDPSIAVAYREYWSTRDPLLAPFAALRVGIPLPDYELMRLEDWERSALFNELAKPAGLPYILPALLHRSTDRLVALSLKTSFRHGPFRSNEVRRLQTVIPHLQRSLAIRDRLAQAQLRADNLSQSFSNLSFGVLILDGRGRLIEANSVAQALMSTKEGVTCLPDRTLALQGPAGKTLARWIGTGKPSSHGVDGLLKIPQPSGQPLSALVTPLPTTTTSWITGDPRWMLLLFDPERRIRVSTELIAQDLGVSAREAQIAARLVMGEDLLEIAQFLGISLHTVRTHLKTIFSKTGIRSQAELIQRIASGPAGTR